MIGKAVVVGAHHELPKGYVALASLSWLDRNTRACLLVAYAEADLENMTLEDKADGIASAISGALRDGIKSGRIQAFRTPLPSY